MMDKLKVFMIMPFQDRFFEVYEMLKRHFAEAYEFSNATKKATSKIFCVILFNQSIMLM